MKCMCCGEMTVECGESSEDGHCSKYSIYAKIISSFHKNSHSYAIYLLTNI